MEQWNDRARPCRRSLNRAVSTEDPEQSFRTGDSHLVKVLPPPLSSDLAALRLSSAGRSMTVDELQAALKGRGVAMLLLLLALPFCLVPVSGLSTPFGIAVLLIGIRIAFLQKPWLPKFIRQRRISAPRLVKVLSGGIRFAKLMEKGREAPDAFSAFLAGRDESNWSRYRCWGPASLTAASDPFQQHGACLGGSALDRGNDGKRRFGGVAGSHSDARLVGRDLPCVAFWRGRHPKALEDVVLIPIAR